MQNLFNIKKYFFLVFSLFLVATLLFVPQSCRADLAVGLLINFPPLFIVFSLFGVIVIEAWLMKYKLKETGRRSLLASLMANGVTFLIGGFCYLNIGKWLLYIFHSRNIQDYFIDNWFLFFLLLCFGSVIIEFFIIRYFFKKEEWKLLFQVSFEMNILSYVFLFVLVFADAIIIGTFIIAPLLIFLFLNLFFEKYFKNIGKPKAKKIKLLLVILAIIIFTAFFILLEKDIPNPSDRARDVRIKSGIDQLRTQAVLIWNDSLDKEHPNKGYSNFACGENQSINQICKYIKEQSGEYPIIYANKDNYCVYAKLVYSKNSWFCVDSEGGVTETTIDPGSFGYCDGNTFTCPPQPAREN